VDELGLIGFGAFGQFLARYLAPHFRISAYGHHDITEEAAELGVEPVTQDEAAAKPVVILCIPVQKLRQLLGEIAPVVRPDACLVDVSSTKVLPLAWMEELLPGSVEIVGTHPLFGPQSGRDGIAGLPVALCPVRTERTECIRRFLADTLELVVIETTPEAHDRKMAEVQVLTHFIGRALKALDVHPSRFSTTAHKHLAAVRALLQDDSDELFRTIQRENPFAAEKRADLLRALTEIDRELG
jgi:prephenate dehydrogenase